MKLFVLLSAILFAGVVYSRCATDEKLEKLYAENPEMKVIHEELYSRISEISNKRVHERRLGKRMPLEPIVIPCVWHIVHNSEGSLVSMERINTEMGYLNAWFSNNNPLFETTSEFWADDVATADDLQIQFVLASFDPNGISTTGVEFMESSTADACTDSEAFRFAESGGLDVWDRSAYLNIHTCLFTDGTLGYAYLPFPDTPAEEDGIIVGAAGVGDAFYSGSTIAHEVGHFLGLYHTFQRNNQDTFVCGGPGDFIDDTPETLTPLLDGLASCPGQGDFVDEDFQDCGHVLMAQNCMDYNVEECITFFSKGQASMMRTFLDNPSLRSTLASSPGLPHCEDFDCFGKNCGDDSCGGTCGTCGEQQFCSEFDICESPNESCLSATTIPISYDMFLEEDSISFEINNIGADETVFGCGYYIFDALWFSIEVPEDISILFQTKTGFIDTNLALFEGPCGDICLVSSDVAGFYFNDFQSRFAFDLRAGTTYSLVVGGFFNSLEGPMVLEISALPYIRSSDIWTIYAPACFTWNSSQFPDGPLHMVMERLFEDGESEIITIGTHIENTGSHMWDTVYGVSPGMIRIVLLVDDIPTVFGNLFTLVGPTDVSHPCGYSPTCVMLTECGGSCNGVCEEEGSVCLSDEDDTYACIAI